MKSFTSARKKTMLNVIGKLSEATFPQVKAVQLEVGRVYLSAEKKMNDAGEESIHLDYAFVHEDSVPGNIKKMKLIRFLVDARTKRLSEIPGIAFCGPVNVGLTEEDEVPQENPDTGMSLADRIRIRNADKMDHNK